MDKKTVWISACIWISFHAVTCGVCATLPTQITTCLNIIRNDYNIYFFAKAIVLMVAAFLLGITHRYWRLNCIYFVGLLISFWAIADVSLIWILLGTCDDKLTGHFGIIIVNILHSAVGCIAFIVICIWCNCGSQEDQTNTNQKDNEAQPEDPETIFGNNRKGFTIHSFRRESEEQHTRLTSDTDAPNENHTPIAEVEAQEEADTTTIEDTTEDTNLTTSSTVNLITSTPYWTYPQQNTKKRKRIYHRSNSASKETQTEPISFDEDNITPITCPLRGAAPSEQIDTKYVDSNQTDFSITTNPLMDDSEQRIQFKQRDRIVIKDNFASKTVCQDSLIGVDRASCRCFIENVPG